MADQTPADEQSKDIAERIDIFNKGYQKLVDETQVDFSFAPRWVPVGPGLFSTTLHIEPQDKKYLEIKSPLSP